VRKLERKRWLLRHDGTWEANIKMYLKVIGWKIVEDNDLYQDRYKWWALAKAPVRFQVF
jgi:hypothetical protein